MTHSQPRIVAASSPAARLSEWLLADGAKIPTVKELIGQLSARLVDQGLPISRLLVLIRTLHPQVMGVRYEWRRDRGTVTEQHRPHEILRKSFYLDSPMSAIFDGDGQIIRRRLDTPDPQLDYPILRELLAAGATDYVAMPLTFTDGKVSALTIASDRQGGFSDQQLNQFYDILPTLSLLLEIHSNRRTARTLLETYLGKHTGNMVLDGMVKRGDGESIHAVIWFCDLRDSTHLAETLSLDSFLGILNDFFDCMAGAVLDHGGEVLRFIGDAALAIFPIGGTSKLLEEACTPSEGACKRALDAARDARQRIDALNKRRQEAGDPPIRYGLALHVGDVMYGNIGVPQRLEFTVIGKAANEAARLEGMCKELGEPIVISSAFPRCFPGEMRSLGTHSLRGVSEPQEVFALTD
ncbi:MAG: adenylate/guanylate cyclase domain-containing protein [Gemmatimonadetes bacterium]|nr:adenylate/guanylate cyclase domain-containing protein [Gemmatimonadota bacterium]